MSIIKTITILTPSSQYNNVCVISLESIDSRPFNFEFNLFIDAVDKRDKWSGNIILIPETLY